MEEKSRYATKKKGKTEVYPFWNMEDIKGMMDYFLEHEMWNHYTTFMCGLLLGRRVGDTLMLLVSDFYYENGKLKDEITTIEEDKTGKTVSIPVSELMKETITWYMEKSGMNPTDNYNDYLFPYSIKTEWIESKKLPIYNGKTTHEDGAYTLIDKWCSSLGKDYSQKRINAIEKEWYETSHGFKYLEDFLYYNVEYKNVIKSQTESYRKKFNEAAKACDIQYPVSTHSTRKTFGYWSKQIHPYDVDSIEILQDIFAHSDFKTTMRYIGLTAERKKKYFDDMSDFIRGVRDGETELIKNSPVVSLKTSDLREILSIVIRNPEKLDDIDLLNDAMDAIEEAKV